MVAIGCILVLLDPLRHFLLDHNGIWFKPEHLAMYADSHHHLTPIGKFCQVATIVGLVLLVTGVILSSAIADRVYEKFCASKL
mmetsp:Transcript_36533/g.104397  ORF Transcript_36533/g.104397 Transcript_36533/m.104397 type:complete len:83 (-) Transcript_36533:98-346(-)